MSSNIADIQVLQMSVDLEHQPSEFRILVDRKFVKYLTIDPGLYHVDVMCLAPVLISMLPPLPPGDWNQGRISRDTSTGRPHFANVTKAQLPGVTNLWHPLRVDHLDLGIGKKLCSNVYEATYSRFNAPIVAKFARFDWEISKIEAETTANEWIDDLGIAPKFVGHLTEEGRVIGFLMERITGFRHATPEDLTLCQQALSRLHGLGIKHGDINKHNILIRDGQATLIDFDSSKRCSDVKELKEEFRMLEKELKDTS
ncbi:hypothetical protein HBH56_146080 [Parastagonospora nodorum]|uniref:Protein kinase domain-containing protein n=1 Tax=Phaeosphaeria nodorum (strain SN15 / ATCC MYA-4574 / FGSC 10173) TaxID=321614 RepID=A0A7U2FA97_PHANO|nr:hypothetical protein HBH56_146080 [Parastagonospora nodorum]QRD01288.1 hypothetical protein JI435_119690 [Parastagonospora nodorum SN15]KAH3927609.1 hypothetical protein HBH54_151270 [Parastagonospora nodorum]KAH3947886.1 hypothetical protein HBH53_111290 [Parastagonospora nodorum]KAH4132294.1 hypothetical protein HBH45_182140 [Parastagonospora nodorum]